MDYKWEKIFDSPKYLKKFLKKYSQICAGVDGGYETTQTHEIVIGFGESDHNHLLFSNNNSIDSGFNLFVYDLETLLDSVKPSFRPDELKYFNMWLLEMSEQEIGDFFCIQRETVHKRLMSVCNKIIKEWRIKSGEEILKH